MGATFSKYRPADFTEFLENEIKLPHTQVINVSP